MTENSSSENSELFSECRIRLFPTLITKLKWPSSGLALILNDLLRSWKGWFNEWNFYLTGLIYMCSRLIVNLSQVYMPFYLTDALKEP